MIGNFPYLQIGCFGGWRRHAHAPVTGTHIGNHADAFVLREGPLWRMWYTQLDDGKIYEARSDDGLTWRFLTLDGRAFADEGGNSFCAVPRRADLGWACQTCQPWVIRAMDEYRMYFCGLSHLERENCLGVIGLARSADGRTWHVEPECILRPELDFEEKMLSYPAVYLRDGVYRMWYTAGGQDRPAVIAYAQSSDGIHWTRTPQPVFAAQERCEAWGVGAPCVVCAGGWHYLAYTAWEDAYKARICLARSRDGQTNWQRHRDNPLITWGIAGAWDVEAVSAPRLVAADNGWRLYYTGRRAANSAIGLALRDKDLGGEEEDWR